MKKALLLIGGVGLLVLSAVLFTGSFVQHVMPPVYQSVARILVKEDSVNFGSLYPDPPAVQRRIERLGSKSVLSQVITNLNLNQKWGAKFKEDAFSIETAYVMLNSQLKIGLAPRNTNIIEIIVRNENPAEAAAIANEIAKVRLEQLSAIDREMTAKSIEALGSMAKTMEIEIQGIEARLKQMAEELNLAVDAPQPDLLAKGDLGTAMLKLRRELQALQVSRERLMSRLQEERVRPLIAGHRPFQLIDSAEPGFRPVEPGTVAKVLMPLGGVLAGAIGVVLLLLAFKIKAAARKLPPPLPVLHS